MAESRETREAKKIMRTIVRLKHSLIADRELDVLLDQYEKVGTTGVFPQIETNLQDILGVDDEDS